MLSLLSFLLLGLGFTAFVGGEDDSNAPSADSSANLDESTGDQIFGDGDLLDQVTGIELGVVQGDPDDETTYITEPLIGGEGDDTLTGGENADTLSGAGGNDQITGSFGADVLAGNAGNDTLDGGEGADVVDGGEGDDIIIGVDGSDTLTGGAGNDILISTATAVGPAFPFFDPNSGEQDGTSGRVGYGSNTTGPSDQPQALSPPAPVSPTEAQVVIGGAGDDVLIADTGDTLSGGDGIDTFVVDTSVGSSLGPTQITDFDPVTESLTLSVNGLVGGDPSDPAFAVDVETRDSADGSALEILVQGSLVVTLAGVSESDELSISVVAANAGDANPGTLTNFGDGNDTASGDLSDDSLNGGAGDDSLSGAAGRDVISGDAGNDTLDGGAGRDDLSGGAGNDLLISGGNDEPTTSPVVPEVLDGGEGDDTLQASDGASRLTGGAGSDLFEITRTDAPTTSPTNDVAPPVTEIADLDVATETVEVTFVNGDATGSPVPFTLVDASDGSGVNVVVDGESYVFLIGVQVADAPNVLVNGAP